MTVRDYRRAFLDRWRIIVAGLVVGLVVAAALAILAPARYSSSVTIFLAAPTNSTDANQTYQSDVLARERAKYYVPLVTEDRVTAQVAQRVGAGLTSRGVAGAIVTLSPADTPLLQITASDSSPALARRSPPPPATRSWGSSATSRCPPRRRRPRRSSRR